MKTNEPLPAVGDAGNLGDGKGGCVGCQNRLRPGDLVDISKDLVLKCLVFENRFDNQICCSTSFFEVDCEMDVSHCRLHCTLFDELAHAPFDRSLGFLQHSLGNVMNDHGISHQGTYLSNSASHDAGAYDSYVS